METTLSTEVWEVCLQPNLSDVLINEFLHVPVQTQTDMLRCHSGPELLNVQSYDDI